MCDCSKIVPTFAVNCLRHCEHFHRPIRALRLPGVADLDTRRYGSAPPQCGQAAPFGQRSFSNTAMASSSVRNLVRETRLPVVFMRLEWGHTVTGWDRPVTNCCTWT